MHTPSMPRYLGCGRGSLTLSLVKPRRRIVDPDATGGDFDRVLSMETFDARTRRAWLERPDTNSDQALEILTRP